VAFGESAWRIWGRRLAVAGLGLGAALVLGSFVPKRLPEPELPNRVLARPHRILPGHDVEASDLVARLGRLGYRRVRRAPGIGEYSLTEDRVVIGRRDFAGPDGPWPAERFELRLGWSGRVGAIRDSHGRARESVALDPETIGALADHAPIDRVLVPLGELPKHLVDAVLVTEDRRFYEHRGLDLRRIGGALFANLRAGRVSQGGSTITQQLVKNVFLSHERSVLRKLREAWLALRVERAHSKPEILEAYLNTIYLGQRGPVSVVGVEAAARHYFGSGARTLGLAESALLAGMIRGPGLYSPFQNPERALTRRKRVLERMARAGVITEAEAKAAAKRPLGAVAKSPAGPRPAFFLAKLERDLADELPDIDLEDDRVVVFSGLDAQLQLEAESAVARGIEELERSFPQLAKAETKLQAALVALEPASGAILAYVGGRSFGESQFDRVEQARRQPGSAFKPIVLLAALSGGPEGPPAFTLASLLEDEPLEVPTPQGPWRPANYAKEFRGRITLRRALEDSVNVPFARVGLALGPEAIVEVAERIGIESRLQAVPSLALGAGDVSPLELARAYALLANGGERVELRAAFHLTDAAGKLLRELPPVRSREFDPAEVALVTSALEGAVDHGTGRALREMGYEGPVAGKTGTTNDARDAWFVGYTPELVAAVWVGFDDGTPLGLTGARAALPIFGRFLIAALGPEGGRAFPDPPGLEYVAIHEPTGLRAGFLCWGDTELFLEGTAPREHCGPGWFARSEPPEERRRRGGEPDSYDPYEPRDAPPPDPIGGFFEALGDLLEHATRSR
jgi:penicillin-binding protein 1B